MQRYHGAIFRPFCLWHDITQMEVTSHKLHKGNELAQISIEIGWNYFWSPTQKLLCSEIDLERKRKQKGEKERGRENPHMCSRFV